MSDGSRIEWTQATWNPITGCTRISDGCAHCYIERTPPLRMTGRRFDRPGTGATTGVQLHPDRISQPLRWRRPRRVFVCSLADLFHPAVPDEVLAQVWAVMAASPRHTFQVLTKRHARLRAWLGGPAETAVRAAAGRTRPSPAAAHGAGITWPLPNVWVGVSTETQWWADLRIPALLATPAAVRWISAEPLLGPLDLTRWLPTETVASPGLDWVVVGGESGPGARPMDLDAAAQIVQQCRTAHVPVFVKQLGTRHGGRDHHDIETFPPPLQVRQYPTVHEAVTRCRA